MHVDLREATANTVTRRMHLAGAADPDRLRPLLAALEAVAWFRLEGQALTVAYDVGRLDFAALMRELQAAGIAVDQSGLRRWRSALYRLLDGSAANTPGPTCCGAEPPPKRRD